MDAPRNGEEELYGQELQLKELRGNVKCGQVDGDEQRKEAQKAGEGGACGGDEVILARLEVLDQKIGRRECDGRAVRQHAHPPFREFGAKNIRFFRCAHLFDERIGAVGEKARKIRGIRHAVDLDGAKLFPHRLGSPCGARSLQIAQRDARLRASSHRQKFDLELPRFEPFAHECRIRLHVLHKPFARALDGDVRRRFGNGAHGHLFGAHAEPFVHALPKEYGIARKHLLRKRLHLAAAPHFGRGDVGGECLCRRLAAVGEEGAQHLLAQQVFIRDGVGEKADVLAPRSVRKGELQNILRGQQALEGFCARFQVRMHILHTGSMRHCGQTMPLRAKGRKKSPQLPAGTFCLGKITLPR